MIGILGGMGTQAGLDFCNKLAILNRGKIDQDYPLFVLYNKSNIPIDVIISPEIEVAKSLYRRLEAPGALDNVPFGNDKVKMLEISIEKNCPIKNIPLKKLTEKFPDFKANIVGALRKDKFIYLKKDDQMLEDDNVYVVISSDQLNPILKAFGHNEKISKNVLIIGGGNIGLNLAGIAAGSGGLNAGANVLPNQSNVPASKPVTLTQISNALMNM